ncbi:MAG: hypothetical protein H0T51_19080 [Pirellulales bacterium]|nr:hypothetical protein [Pirellulales bacterium]
MRPAACMKSYNLESRHTLAIDEVDPQQPGLGAALEFHGDGQMIGVREDALLGLAPLVPGDSATWDAIKVLWENELELIRPRS